MRQECAPKCPIKRPIPRQKEKVPVLTPTSHLHSSRLPSLLHPPVPQPSTRLVDPPLLLRDLRLTLALAIRRRHGRRSVLHLLIAILVLVLHALRIRRTRPVHHAQAARTQLINSADRIDGLMQGAARVEILFDSREQVLLAPVGFRPGDPRVRQRFVARHARRRVDGQAALDELAGLHADAAPVLERGEAVVRDEDGLHFLQVAVAVEGRVAAQQEVGDDADGPDVDGLAVPGFLEDLRRHVARRAAGCRQHVELLFVHDAAEAEVGDQQVGVVFWRAEEEVFGFEVAVHDAVIVQVGDGGEGGADQVRGVGFEVAAFAADAVEEFAAEGEVGDEVYCGIECEYEVVKVEDRKRRQVLTHDYS